MNRSRKTIAVFATVVGAIVGAIVGRSVVQLVFHDGNSISFDRPLVEFSKAMNATLPMLVDRETRLDATVAGPGSRLTYLYTLVNYSANDFDEARFAEVMRPRLVNGYKTNPDMAILRSKNVELHYQYRDTDGTNIAAIAISPSDF